MDMFDVDCIKVPAGSVLRAADHSKQKIPILISRVWHNNMFEMESFIFVMHVNVCVGIHSKDFSNVGAYHV